MDLLSLFLIAIGLSMDAFAVSLSNGLAYRGFGRRQAIEAAAAFGLFQALMPVTGYFAGRTFSDAISAFDHWIALGLLAAIGGKMVFDGLHDLRSPKGQIVPRRPCYRDQFCGDAGQYPDRCGIYRGGHPVLLSGGSRDRFPVWKAARASRRDIRWDHPDWHWSENLL